MFYFRDVRGKDDPLCKLNLENFQKFGLAYIMDLSWIKYHDQRMGYHSWQIFLNISFYDQRYKVFCSAAQTIILWLGSPKESVKKGNMKC